MNNVIIQEEAAARYIRKEGARVFELAKKHNITVTMPIHCEYLLEGDAKNIAAFLEDLIGVPKPTTPISMDFDLKTEWVKQK